MIVNMINVEALTATLSDGKEILKDISFSLPESSKLAIIGPNGSGKSTLMQALLGMIPASFNRYDIAGNDFTNLSIKERAKLMSYISQQQMPEGSTTTWEWCELSRYPHGTSKAENNRIIEEALIAVDALPFATRALASLSGGERQRVYMAGAIAQESTMIFLDEVNAALDPKHRDALNQLIAGQVNKTILSITHDINALDCYTHLLALKAGKVVAFGKRDEVMAQALLADLFEYQFREVIHQGQARYF